MTPTQGELLKLCEAAFVEVRYLTNPGPEPEHVPNYGLWEWRVLANRLSWLADLCHNLPARVQDGIFSAEEARELADKARLQGLLGWARAFEQLARGEVPVERPEFSEETEVLLANAREDEKRAGESHGQMEEAFGQLRAPWWKRLLGQPG